MTTVSSRTIDKTFYIFCTPRKSYLHSFSKFNYKGLFDGCGLLIFVHFFFLPSIQISWWEVTFEDLSIKRQTYFAFFREKQFAIFFKTAFGYKSRNRKIQSMKEKKMFCQNKFFLPCSKTTFSLDVSKIIFDGDAVKTRSEIFVKTRSVQMGGHQLICGNVTQAIYNFSMLVGQICWDWTIEFTTQLHGIIQGILHSCPRSKERARHQNHPMEQS